MTFDVGFVFDDDSSIDDIEPNLDSHSRRLVLLLFDLSGSMGVSRRGVRPVDALNTQIEQWLPQVHRRAADELRNVEFAVLTFGDRAVRLHAAGRSTEFAEENPVEPWMAADQGAFMPAAQLRLDRFTAGGTTPMVSALQIAIQLGDARARTLADAGVTTGQIRTILFTDGSPNDQHLPRDAWRTVADDLAERRRQRRGQLLAFGVPHSDERILRALAGDDGYFPLRGFDFGMLLELITIASAADDPYETFRAVFDEHDADPDAVTGSAD
jgi:uncharacterized protein YegL